MCGGIIVNILGEVIEVLDPLSFDRCWRRLSSEGAAAVREQDGIWWMSHRAYLTRKPEFADLDIGPCHPAAQNRSLNHPKEPT